MIAMFVQLKAAFTNAFPVLDLIPSHKQSHSHYTQQHKDSLHKHSWA